MKQFLYISFVLLLVACAGSKDIDRSIRPTPGPAPAINLGKFEKFDLDNGLKVIVVENHKIPRVSYQIRINRMPVLEGDVTGAVSMMGGLLKSGTDTKSKAEIDESIDFIGASINTSATSIYGSSIKKHSDKMLELMSDILINPSFPESEIEKSKKQSLSGIASSKTSPDQMSSNIKSIMRYGPNHPYGEVATEASIERITREDIEGFYSDYYDPNWAYLIIVGDVTPEEARANAKKYFEPWTSDQLLELDGEPLTDPKENYRTPVEPDQNRVAFVPLADAVQSVISVTYPVDLKPASDQAIAASVMNSILGGGVFSGRLMQNLREDKAFTYSARSGLNANSYVGSFSAGCSVRNEVTDSAIVEILYEMRRMTEELVPDSTLQFVKNAMNGSFARSLENPQTIARFARNIERYNLPDDYYATYLEKLSAVTAEDVLKAAQTFIRPDNCYITVVGNKDEVADKLAVFAASGEVEFYDMFGEEWRDIQPVPAGVNLGVVFDAYLKGLGGADKLAEITSYKQKSTMSAMGATLNIESWMKDNSKYRMEMSMGNSILVERSFDGVSGYVTQMGAKEDLSAGDMEELKVQADLLSVLRYQDHEVEAKLLGIEKVNDEEAYVVELTYPSGTKELDYYSVASGLKIMVVRTEESKSGQSVSTTTIQSYKDVGEVKFPEEFIVSADGQEAQISVSEVKLNVKIPDSKFQ